MPCPINDLRCGRSILRFGRSRKLLTRSTLGGLTRLDFNSRRPFEALPRCVDLFATD